MGASAAVAQPPAITLQPTCGPVAATVTVNGVRFLPGPSSSPITVTFDPGGSPVSQVVVPGQSISQNGSFTTTIAVPARPQRSAPYPITATQTVVGAQQISASAPFSVPCPTVTPNPNCGSVGDRILVHGAGFRADIRVEVSFEPPAPAKPDATVVPRPDSTFDVAITVPNRPPGVYAFLAVQTGQPPLAARGLFQIPCVKAAIKLLPTVGPWGTVTTVIGTGFPVGAVVKLSWDRGIPISAPPILIDATGGFQLNLFIFPHDTLGSRRLSAGPDLHVANAPIFNIATADFLVVPGTVQPRDFSWRH